MTMRFPLDFVSMRPSRGILTILGFIAIALGCATMTLGVLLLKGPMVRDASADTLSLLGITCDDFASWDLADDHFAHLDPTSVEAHILDSNRNNIPCEGSKPRDHQTHEIFDVICDDFHHRDEAEKFF